MVLIVLLHWIFALVLRGGANTQTQFLCEFMSFKVSVGLCSIFNGFDYFYRIVLLLHYICTVLALRGGGDPRADFCQFMPCTVFMVSIFVDFTVFFSTFVPSFKGKNHLVKLSLLTILLEDIIIKTLRKWMLFWRRRITTLMDLSIFLIFWPWSFTTSKCFQVTLLDDFYLFYPLLNR